MFGSELPIVRLDHLNNPYNKELYEMCLAHFNEPIIITYDLCIVRVVGYAETLRDCYILVRHPEGKLGWVSCVGGYVFLDRLRGQNYVKSGEGEYWDDFTRLDGALYFNAPKEKTFILDMNDDLEY